MYCNIYLYNFVCNFVIICRIIQELSVSLQLFVQPFEDTFFAHLPCIPYNMAVSIYKGIFMFERTNLIYSHMQVCLKGIFLKHNLLHWSCSETRPQNWIVWDMGTETHHWSSSVSYRVTEELGSLWRSILLFTCSLTNYEIGGGCKNWLGLAQIAKNIFFAVNKKKPGEPPRDKVEWVDSGKDRGPDWVLKRTRHGALAWLTGSSPTCVWRGRGMPGGCKINFWCVKSIGGCCVKSRVKFNPSCLIFFEKLWEDLWVWGNHVGSHPIVIDVTIEFNGFPNIIQKRISKIKNPNDVYFIAFYYLSSTLLLMKMCLCRIYCYFYCHL